jgi:pimeloyl-ACP methyl ester carboxylesterase
MMPLLFDVKDQTTFCLQGGGAFMKHVVGRTSRLLAVSIGVLGLFASPVTRGEPGGIVSKNANVEGVTLHYTTAGQGPAVVLLHGYAETSRMWMPIIPRLADRFRVIAPDLPGIGDSSIPQEGLDMKSAATLVHALIRSLGIERARVVGHDIGLMVAYAYAAQYPNEVEKLVLMDAFLPGVEEWEAIYNNPGLWHFRFNGPTPEKLVVGRERTYFEHYWNDFAADPAHSIPESERVAYTAAYSRPGRMRAGWAYFASFTKTAADFAEFSKTKLPMPVLSIGGDKANGEALGRQARLVASDATVVIVKNSGHWLMEEQPSQTVDALVRFLQ